jgi:hypothetical protein
MRTTRFRPGIGLTALAALLVPILSVSAADPPAFFRGINLNGPPVTIDGHKWEGSESKNYVCQDNAFENQSVPLIPPTDADRAKMIRSSRWGGNRVELTNLPQGPYTLFVYVWEDNRSENFSVSLNGNEVVKRYSTGPAGTWARLGPWFTEPREGKLILTSVGGAANFSGIEIWKGRYEGQDAPPTEDELAFFEKRIRPLLVNHCYECHSAESKDLQGDLLVDSRPTIRRGGGSGPAVVPGNVDASLLIKAVRYADPDMEMPPDGKLSDAEIADLVKWVEMGAPDPRTTATKHVGKQIDVAAAREFWSLRPLVAPEVPAVRQTGWPASDIDRFVLAKLEEQNLTPAPPADKRALLRRATFDLIGLPPTPHEVLAFLQDDSPRAFENVVDRLLDSPRYGERWGRHWLDVVRYADTAGDNSDYPIPQMHRYRDWVIEAFNRDLPYDEFVRDQLAGDLRGGSTEQERQERLIATGYIANSRRFGSRVDDYPQHLTIEDTIDNLGRAFLGMTLSCARCHDHKFDPISNRDYYALYGIFHSTRYPWPGIELDKQQRDFIPLVPADQLAAAEKAVAERSAEQKRLNKELSKLKEQQKSGEKDGKENLKERIREVEAKLKALRESPLPFELAYAVADAEKKEDAYVQQKGDPTRPGDLVPRRFLTVLGGSSLPSDCQTSGRDLLAEWLLSPDNPLPARVMANRIWQHHFGRGIVTTPNDFGKQGKPPTHPELLDHLAISFRAYGWSIKSMHRRIMLSKTYQQSSQRAEEAIAKDPNNDWLAGFPRRRLDAESIRDTLLALGGNLDLSPAGPHPFPPQDSWNFTQHNPFKAVYESRRRSVYLMTQRIQRHPYLAIFDGADPSTSTAARMVSTTPLQALFLLNDPLVHEQSRLIAERLLRDAPDENSRLSLAFELLFSRPADEGELAAARQFLARADSMNLQAAEAATSGDRAQVASWSALVRSLLRLNEFVYLD